MTAPQPCQRWRQRRPSWARDTTFDPRDYEVHPVAHVQARAFVETHHYSAAYPAARFRHGLYRGGALVGVAVHSVPMRREVLTAVFPDLTPYAESVELGRFVLLDAEPPNSESWFLAEVHRQLAAAGVAGVVSFSDPMRRVDAAGRVVMPGHVGTIYQASNAGYLGRSSAGTLTVLRDGTVFSDRTAQKIRAQERGHDAAERYLIALGAPAMPAGQKPAVWLRGALAEVGARKVQHPGNHRYAFKLGTRRQRAQVRVAMDRCPYPKGVDPT